MAESPRTEPPTTRGSAAEEPSAGAGAAEPAEDGGHVCNVAFCPIGLALSAVQPLRPEAVEHLLVAGRELFLAMRAVVDGRAEQFAGEDGSSDLEKIDIG